jgi:hypothetical protein
MELIKNNRVKDGIYILIAGFILCFMGFFNKYPLVFPDTGTYILSGFTNVVPKDRPIMYGLFIRHVSLWESLWLVIVVQGMLVSLSVFYYFKYLSINRNYLPFFLLYIFLITFFTGASINVSQLIPDVFTSISILSLGLLIFVRHLKLRDLIIISVLLVLSISVHTSHVMLIILVSLLLSLCYLFKRFRQLLPFLKYQRILLVWSLILFTCLTVSLVHYGFGGGFTMSKGKHVFLMGRFIEMGILNDYLQDNCDDKKYEICAYKDMMMWDFIWDEKNSPLYKTGGWEANKEEYLVIIKDIFITPKYFKTFLIKSIGSGFIQFFNFETGDTPRLDVGSAPHSTITSFFEGQEMEYLSSRQCKGKLDYFLLNNCQNYFFAFSLFFLLLFLVLRMPLEVKYTIVYILIALLINAMVCGTFSGISPRYQSRVIWLLPLPLILSLTNKSTLKILIGRG